MTWRFELSAPFVERALPRRTFFEWLLGRKSSRAALAEVENQLARAGRILDVSGDAIDAIARRYALAIRRKLVDELCALYRRYLEHATADRNLAPDELASLEHLVRVLGLRDCDVRPVHESVARNVYGASVRDAMADGRLTPGERAFLDGLQRQLTLSDDIADKIFSAQAHARFDGQLKAAVADQRLSPDEDRELQAIARSLNIFVETDACAQADLLRMRTLWQIENGEIPTIAADINLYKNEKCYFIVAADWLENRRRTRSIRYSGPSVSFRIMKGVYWRAGSANVQRVTEDVLENIDRGRVYITDRRLIFRGERKNTTLRYSSVLAFSPYRDGVEIEKSSGRNPIFRFEENIDLFCAILSRALRDT